MKHIVILFILLFSIASSAKEISAKFVRSIDQSLEIAKGTLPLHSGVNKFGTTDNADSGVPTDIWSGANGTVIWAAPTQARLHNIASTSISDDGAPVGVGARTIRLFGLTSWDTVEVSEDIILNGIGNVPTENAYVIINRMKVLTKGATSINVGTITATAQVDGTITARIEIGQGQTQMAIFGVPSVQDAYMTKFSASAKRAGGATKSIDIALLINPDPANELLNFITGPTGGLVSSGGGRFVEDFNPYSKIEGPVIIKLQANSDTNDAEVSGRFDLILVDK